LLLLLSVKMELSLQPIGESSEKGKLIVNYERSRRLWRLT